MLLAIPALSYTVFNRITDIEGFQFTLRYING